MPEKATAAAAAAAGSLGRNIYRIDIVNVMDGRITEEDEMRTLRILVFSSALC